MKKIDIGKEKLKLGRQAKISKVAYSAADTAGKCVLILMKAAFWSAVVCIGSAVVSDVMRHRANKTKEIINKNQKNYD